MSLHTATAAPTATLSFVAPPPGLGALTEFTLTPVTDELYSLQAANLLAPMLVDLATGSALQTILESSDQPLRAPLTR